MGLFSAVRSIGCALALSSIVLPAVSQAQSATPQRGGTLVRIVHVWNGPSWPLIGDVAARAVIGPVFVHGIASRTLAGLARTAERTATDASRTEVAR